MLFKEIRLPKKIKPCPIREAIVEILFEHNIVDDAVFGMFYGCLSIDYPNITKLPILNIPFEIRAKNDNFAFQPHYKMYDSTGNFSIQIGPRIISIVHSNLYQGWPDFLTHINKIIATIKSINIISKIIKFGMRYIDFFDNNIYNDINLTMNDQDGPINNFNNGHIKLLFDYNKMNIILQIANNIHYKKTNQGSIIDIDVIHRESPSDPVVFFTKYSELLEIAHKANKILFFNLIKEDVLNSKYVVEYD